jgi:hypothetical protein
MLKTKRFIPLPRKDIEDEVASKNSLRGNLQLLPTAPY